MCQYVNVPIRECDWCADKGIFCCMVLSVGMSLNREIIKNKKSMKKWKKILEWVIAVLVFLRGGTGGKGENDERD